MAMKILPVTRSSCLLNLLPTVSCFLIFDTTILPVSDGFIKSIGFFDYKRLSDLEPAA
jgi:hypothetical protein